MGWYSNINQFANYLCIGKSKSTPARGINSGFKSYLIVYFEFLGKVQVQLLLWKAVTKTFCTNYTSFAVFKKLMSFSQIFLLQVKVGTSLDSVYKSKVYQIGCFKHTLQYTKDNTFLIYF